ncbi:hypothetical protein MMC11_004915 [Xylographa trunciseda]|nr:hypothetical protein [Xylographa trunciseda]
MDPTIYPEEIRKYYVEARQQETQPAVHMFWINWVKWHLGAMMTVEEEDVEDGRQQGTGRTAFKISWEGKVQMIAQTSRCDDVDAELMLAQKAQDYLDLKGDCQIFGLDCRATRCNVLRMWTDAGEIEWEVIARDIELPGDYPKLAEAFSHGFANLRIPGLEKRTNS